MTQCKICGTVHDPRGSCEIPMNANAVIAITIIDNLMRAVFRRTIVDGILIGIFLGIIIGWQLKRYWL